MLKNLKIVTIGIQLKQKSLRKWNQKETTVLQFFFVFHWKTFHPVSLSLPVQWLVQWLVIDDVLHFLWIRASDFQKEPTGMFGEQGKPVCCFDTSRNNQLPALLISFRQAVSFEKINFSFLKHSFKTSLFPFGEERKTKSSIFQFYFFWTIGDNHLNQI